MRPSRQRANPGLAALIAGSGFRSLERFAQVVNQRGWEMSGVKLAYDHVSVKRWLSGSVCQNPDVVAAVLSEAWGIPIPVQAIWPELRDGTEPVPGHLTPWVAARTLDDLGAFIGSDMLTRRDVLAGSVAAVTGQALIDPLARWLGAGAIGLPASAPAGHRIGLTQVEGVEQATRQFATVDANVGGALSREAAVGQLKYAVDLVRYSSYSDLVGNRLLAAVAGLSGLVGWMCHDSGMRGPAQRYLTYGLQAAKESTDPRGPLLAVRILGDMGQMMRRTDHPDTAVRLLELALNQLPQGPRRFNKVRAMLSGQRAWALAYLGTSALPEVRGALALSVDLYDSATDDDCEPSDLPHRSLDLSRAHIAATAASAYLVLARDKPGLGDEAADHTLFALAHAPAGHARNHTLNHIRLARTRFAAGEPDQGCEDATRALVDAEHAVSWMVTTRLRELHQDTEPYREQARVRELRERLREAATEQR